MNRDDIIRMAREAGMEVVDDQFSLLPFLERFFHMAQAAEREACAQLCDELDDIGWKECGEYKSGYSEAIRARSIE
jgi:hypothetical protein